MIQRRIFLLALLSLATVVPATPRFRQTPAAPAQEVKALPFEKDIEAFEAADRVAPPAKGGIVFVGSSSIRRWNTLKEDFPGYNVINRGFGGSQISDSVNFAKRIVTPYAPKMIVFFAGSNDLAAGKSPETVAADYRAFVAQVRSEMPIVPIAFVSITPAPSRWNNLDKVKQANTMIQAFTKTDPNLKFVNVFPLMLTPEGGPRPELFVADQLHMKPAGYAIWTKEIRPLLPNP